MTKPWYKRSKFWTVTVAAVVMFLSDALGLKIQADTLAAITTVVLGYCAAQGYVDGKSGGV